MPLPPSAHTVHVEPELTPNGILPLGKAIEVLNDLWALMQPVPPEWVTGDTSKHVANGFGGSAELLPRPCTLYAEVQQAWRKALRWRPDLDDALVAMLAVAISTEQVGDQLFLQVIGDAGSAKTRLCEAMLVSKTCYPLDHLTGFHSGWKDADGKDYSLISRINRKTLITAEGNTLADSPHYIALMSQSRRIFDGSSGASYKNRDEDLRYTGLRTPWIMAGTPALMNYDQSRLGDRFLKVWIGQPDEDEKNAILKRVAFSAMRAVMQKSESDAHTQLSPELCEASCLTGGYIEYLKNNVCELLSQLVFDEDEVAERCAKLGEFVAGVRARPSEKKEAMDTKELPTRLTHQFVRFACCAAAVLNKKTIDKDVMRRVTKLGLDTCTGVTLKIVKKLYQHTAVQTDGVSSDPLYLFVDMSLVDCKAMLRFMKQIELVDVRQDVEFGIKGKPKWRLTERMVGLYESVYGIK